MSNERYRGFRPPAASSRKKNDLTGGEWCLLIGLGLLVFSALVVLGGLFTLVAWNVGVVGIVAAAGGTVGKISLGIAICANIAIGVIGRIFRPVQVARANAAK